jgi:hypothetical protein
MDIKTEEEFARAHGCEVIHKPGFVMITLGPCGFLRLPLRGQELFRIRFEIKSGTRIDMVHSHITLYYPAGKDDRGNIELDYWNLNMETIRRITTYINKRILRACMDENN